MGKDIARNERYIKVIRLCWLALGLAGGLILWLGLNSRSHNTRTDGSTVNHEAISLDRLLTDHHSLPGQASPRAIYPYSVIPGGAHSVPELKDAIARDPIVEIHYANFNLRKARLMWLRRAETAYVSYRLGNHIYWTKRKVRLPSGEAVITDGKYMARTRCGNRISATPMKPTSVQEPTEAVLDSPGGSEMPVASFQDPIWLPQPVLTLPFSEPTPPDQPVMRNAPSEQTPDAFSPPLFFPAPLPPGGEIMPKTPQLPSVPVPEPGVLTLLLTALPVIWLLVRRLGNNKGKC